MDRIPGIGMNRIAMMGMGVDRSKWGWAGMGMDRIARMGMGRDRHYLPGWTVLSGWGWAWIERIAWMGIKENKCSGF